jgi:major histocompatibility complex class I
MHIKIIQNGFKKILTKPGVVAHAFNPSTGEAEAGGFLSSRPAWSTK